MITLFKRLFKKDNSVRLTGRVINMWQHKSWGDNIFFNDYEKRSITGWLYKRPVVGDEIRAGMESGKIGRFCVTEVQYMSDPSDMFFCTVSDIGYLE